MNLAINLDANNLWWIYPAFIAVAAAGAGLGRLINWAYWATGRRP